MISVLINTSTFLIMVIVGALVFLIPFYIAAYCNKTGIAIIVLITLLSLLFAGIAEFSKYTKVLNVKEFNYSK